MFQCRIELCGRPNVVRRLTKVISLTSTASLPSTYARPLALAMPNLAFQLVISACGIQFSAATITTGESARDAVEAREHGGPASYALGLSLSRVLRRGEGPDYARRVPTALVARA